LLQEKAYFFRFAGMQHVPTIASNRIAVKFAPGSRAPHVGAHAFAFEDFSGLRALFDDDTPNRCKWALMHLLRRFFRFLKTVYAAFNAVFHPFWHFRHQQSFRCTA
jgi:hypothetical protein